MRVCSRLVAAANAPAGRIAALLALLTVGLPGPAAARTPEGPEPPTAKAPAVAAPLPPVRVRLASLGSPAALTVSGEGVRAITAAGDPVSLDGPARLTAIGNSVRLASVLSPVIRVEGERLEAARGKCYPGVLLVTARAGRLTVVNECPFERYVEGVLCGECPASFEPEAIRAMAIAARSYSYRKAFLSRAELCDTVHCQVYRGCARVPESIRAAVESTAGTVALFDGEVIDGVYCSDCGGYTESSEDAWKGGKAVPYLRAVEDAPEPHGEAYCAVNRAHTWTLTLPFSRLGALAGKAGGLTLALPELTASGRARRIELVRAAPKDDTMSERGSPMSALKSFIGEQWRRLIGLSSLKSLLFEVVETANGVELRGRGFGHGVGLCQFGANGMAKHGAPAEVILKHYYTGIEVGAAPAPGSAASAAPTAYRGAMR